MAVAFGAEVLGAEVSWVCFFGCCYFSDIGAYGAAGFTGADLAAGADLVE